MQTEDRNVCFLFFLLLKISKPFILFFFICEVDVQPDLTGNGIENHREMFNNAITDEVSY